MFKINCNMSSLLQTILENMKEIYMIIITQRIFTLTMNMNFIRYPKFCEEVTMDTNWIC